MKSHFSFLGKSLLYVFVAAGFFCSTSLQAQITWKGGGTQTLNGFDFLAGDNWIGSTAPVNGEAAIVTITTATNIDVTAPLRLNASASVMYPLKINLPSGANPAADLNFYGDGALRLVMYTEFPTGANQTSVLHTSGKGSVTFNNPVIVQPSTAGTGGRGSLLYVTHQATGKLEFSRLILDHAADATGAGAASMNGLNIRVLSLEDFALATKTGIFVIAGTTSVYLYDTSKFTGTIKPENVNGSATNGLTLMQNLSATAKMDYASGFTLKLANGVVFDKAAGYSGGAVGATSTNTYGAASIAEGGGTATFSGAITFNRGAGVFSRFYAPDTTSKLHITGTLTNTGGTSGDFLISGNGQVLFMGGVNFGTTANIGTTKVGENAGNAVLFGGSVNWPSATTVSDNAGLTNAGGSMNFTGGLNISAMTTDGRLVFDLSAPWTTAAIRASTINMGALNVSEFSFNLIAGFTTGEYVLFQTASGFTNVVSLDTQVFDIGGYSGQLAWSSDNNSILLNVTAIPEPTAFALLGVSFLALAVWRKRKIF